MSEFGELLHGWRDRLSPVDVGFAATSGRRAPGLRREELAQLAGLSVDYVLRLEQGRAKNPSAQVVGSLARALQLSRGERDQLYRSAGLLPPQDGTISAHVPASIQRLAVRLGDVPIGVFTADWTLVWWNAMWCALNGDPSAIPVEQRNLARALPQAQTSAWSPTPQQPEPPTPENSTSSASPVARPPALRRNGFRAPAAQHEGNELPAQRTLSQRGPKGRVTAGSRSCSCRS